MPLQRSRSAPERRVFCNRTLNLRSIRAIGFDMDYTLVHYDVRAWEARAYAHVQQRLLERGHAGRASCASSRTSSRAG
jgi:5'-nucleotidase